MSSRRERDAQLSRVVEHLQKELGVQPCHSLSAFLDPAASDTRVIIRPRPLVLGHLELDPDLSVYDVELGAIGLAWMFEETAGEAATSDEGAIREFVERCIDDAVALRHLCLERARRQSSSRSSRSRSSANSSSADPGPGSGAPGATSSLAELPLAVEAILMIPRSHLPGVGSALRSIVVESGYLYSVGVNLLPLDPAVESPEMARGVRRAFRWLLRSTRGRFGSPPPATATGTPSPATNGAASPAPWSSASRLHLQNYRLQGGRTLELQSFTRPTATPIHLLFGRNGTGKSSLVEALEIVLTGKLEFFEEAHRGLEYGSVLRNNRAEQGDLCAISVEAEHASMDIAITDRPIRNPRNGEVVPPAIPAAACRLDQRLMDKLVTTERKAERAAILLRLLFPQDRDLLARYEAAQRDRRATARLPSAGEIALARSALHRLATWSPSHTTAVGRKTRAELTNEWLRGRTLLMMIRQDQQLTSVLDALKGSWANMPEPQLRNWLDAARPPVPDPATLRVLDQRVSALRASLAQPAPSAEAPQRAVTALSAEERSALDAVGVWIAQSPSRGLSDALAAALEHDQVESFADVVVGRDDWAARLDLRVATLEQAASALHSQDLERFPEIERDEEHHYRQLLLERETLETTLTLESEVDQQLRLRIDALGEPLNELVTLLTPARWAYDDIATKLEGLRSEAPSTAESTAGRAGTHRAGVGMRIASTTDPDGRHAAQPLELRLNTAELNILALAIFLLCAPRVEENAFKLFVLDDPLQNMDELTVSCVARGLAQLQRVWPKDWRVLLTVHGEVNFQCLARELFGAGYELPWLSPGDSQKSAPIQPRSLAIARDARAQTLDSLGPRAQVS